MESKFIELFKEVLEKEEQEMNLSDKFREYEEWDSLAFLSTIAMLDEEYEIIIDTDEFKKIETVGELLDEVKARLSK
ncbi:acyl carrier protein [Brumimicrobium mesophilum]|uniref:acyl carrier protein n=1 Tax=Brumimicrobium mesophilum TaxID=392717 RepID=UPI000D143FE1|nr:acyl carrier protein [Brumimicrobium mesophilum]